VRLRLVTVEVLLQPLLRLRAPVAVILSRSVVVVVSSDGKSDCISICSEECNRKLGLGHRDGLAIWTFLSLLVPTH
jgi:hypothetical protein